MKDKSSGTAIKFPKEAIKTDTLFYKNKYSNHFYNVHKNGYVYFWDNYFQLNDSVSMAFNYIVADKEGILSTKEQKDRKNAVIYSTKEISGDIFCFRETMINDSQFLLMFYQLKNDQNSYFAGFESERIMPKAITGLIRFPATMSLEEIEKQTIKILSGVKLKN